MNARTFQHWQVAILLIAALFIQAITSSAADTTAPTQAVARKNHVDIALVLAVDVSSSIEASERRFQREAYAAALKDPRVARMALGGPTGGVAIAYMEWSGRRYQRVHVPMRVLTSPDDLAAFADEILAIEDRPNDPMYYQATAVGDALIAAEVEMSERGLLARDYVIDISGDGVVNDGLAVNPAREHVLSRGLVVNGLPIELTSAPGTSQETTTQEVVSRFYADCVIGGPGAFHLVARGFGDIRETLIMKLMLEMADMPAEQKTQIAQAWNTGANGPIARIIPAMVLDLSPQGNARNQETDCSNAQPMTFVP